MRLVIVIIIWAGAIGLLLLRGRSPADRSTMYAAVAGGISMTITLESVYPVLDGWLGGRNYANLISSVAFLFGGHWLAHGIARASGGSRPVLGMLLRRSVLGVVIVISAVTFFMIETPGSAARFMDVHGEQLAAVAYSSIIFLYLGAVMLSMVIVCVNRLPRVAGLERAGTAVLLLGGSILLIMCLDVLFMNVMRVTGPESLLRFGYALYVILNTAGFACTAVGLILTPAARRAEARRMNARAFDLVNALTPAWQRARMLGLSSGSAMVEADDAESLLYRQIIEIRDAQASHAADYALSADEIELLERSEALLLGGAPAMVKDA